MTVTRGAKARVQAAAQQAVRAMKLEYAERIRRLQGIVCPALSSAERSAGLGLQAPPEGRPGVSDVGRFLSTAPRFARSRPDTEVRALIDLLLDGDLLLCVQDAPPGARREIVVCEEPEALRLDGTWRLINASGGAAPLRDFELDDDSVWSMLGAAAGPPARATPSALPPPSTAPVAVGGELAGVAVGRIGLGAMRLSTAGRPDRDDALAVLTAALEAGVRLIDSADSYCVDEADRGHNERLIAEALERWSGDRDSVLVATKAGLRRPGGRWIPDGRPGHLRSACEQSLDALQVDALPLMLLHVADPRVPLEDSVGELAKLQEEGKVRHVGVCNVSLDQLVEARTIVDVAAVQNEASLFSKRGMTDGVLAYCAAEGIPVLAHRPIGGHSRIASTRKHKALAKVAARHGASPEQAALAWLLATAPQVIPIPGATRTRSILGSLAATSLRLDADDLATLDSRKPWAPEVRAAFAASTPTAEDVGEMVLVMGSPAAGKTSSVAPYTDAGYVRLNRDTTGGRLDDLLPLIDQYVADGRRRLVLDNTYPDRKSRTGPLARAARHGIPARGIRIDTSPGEAMYNACKRMLQRHGRLLDPEGIRRESRRDPNMFPPDAIWRYFRRFEEPTEAEGFAELSTVPFDRVAPDGEPERALLLDLDGTVRTTTRGAPFPIQPDDVHLLPRRKEILHRYAADGWRLLGVTNQAGVSLGQLTEEQVVACIDRTRELLELDFEVLYCPHPPGRIACWCRKPMPGMGVQHLEKWPIDRAASLMVGDRDSDADFAANLGVPFQHADEFFAGP